MAHDLLIDQFSPGDDGDKPLATWYAQGHSDALGDRLLMFDNTSAPSWEILRFRPALARDGRFEAAIREQMERLASFQHPAFPVIRPIAELGQDDGLAVVSTFAPGPRLSEALKKPRSVPFAIRMLRQLVPALAALQEHDFGIVHGALNAERIVVTADGSLMIREHMIGAALATLGLSATSLWADFGLLMPPGRGEPPAIDSRSDVAQMGLVILSLMVGRRIGPDEYPDSVDALLDGIAERSNRQARVQFQPLRYWLERALQLDDYMFESAREANDALAELRDETERSPESPTSIGSLAAASSDSADADLDARPPARPGPRLIASRRLDDVPETATAPLVLVAPPGDEPNEMVPSAPEEIVRELPFMQRFARIIQWAAVGAAALAVVEAMWIARLLYVRAATLPPVVIAPPPQPSAPAPVGAQPDLQTADAAAIDQKELTAKTVNKPGAPLPPAAASLRTGAFRLTSAVDVHVLDGDRVLGSSGDGPIVAPIGRHEYEFVNSALGYRERRVVDVKPGQVTPVSLTVPNGTLNINAVPWASVWIDGTAYGETPLGNLAIAPGEHEIVFRHPQLGERREKTLVKAAAATRVSVNLQRPKP